MSIFSSIFNRIFPSNTPAATPPALPSTAEPASQAPVQAAQVAATGPAQLDAEQALNALAEKNPQKLNWRTSIVDLLKLLDLDSSLAARKALASELHFAGDQNDSATMNVWLHKEVLKKLAANGGQVPADLKA